MSFRVNYFNVDGNKTTTTINPQLSCFFYCFFSCGCLFDGDLVDCSKRCLQDRALNHADIKKFLQSFVTDYQSDLKNLGLSYGLTKSDIEIEILRRLFLSK